MRSGDDNLATDQGRLLSRRNKTAARAQTWRHERTLKVGQRDTEDTAPPLSVLPLLNTSERLCGAFRHRCAPSYSPLPISLPETGSLGFPKFHQFVPAVIPQQGGYSLGVNSEKPQIMNAVPQTASRSTLAAHYPMYTTPVPACTFCM